jgi:hypothetical protein
MTDRAISGLVAVITAIIGVAIIAVLVSRSSQTANVLRTGGAAFSSIVGAAVGPVSASPTVTGLSSAVNSITGSL